MRANTLLLSTLCASLAGCSSSVEVIPLAEGNALRERTGAEYATRFGVLNFNPRWEASAERTARRVAARTCQLSSTPASEDINLECGGAGISVGIGAMASCHFECPEHGEVIQ